MTFKDYLNILLEGPYPSDQGVVKYHKDIFFPPNWIKDVARFLVELPTNLRQSAHWKYDRSYKHDYTITKADLVAKDIFELAYDGGGRLQKVGFRVRHLDPDYDIIYIISRDGRIVTSWTNSKQDVHRTLDRSRYKSA